MLSGLNTVFRPLMRLGLIAQIALGIIAGVLLVIISPEAAHSVALLGQLFVLALKAVAPACLSHMNYCMLRNYQPKPLLKKHLTVMSQPRKR
jgi:Na+/serine symporter